MNKAALEELKDIADTNGGILQPTDVVAAARPKDNPLHHYFEWDDRKAGYQYRIWQARALIRVSVEMVAQSGQMLLIRF